MAETTICTKCQTINTKGVKFCKKCGIPLETGSAPPPGGERRCAKGHVFEPHWQVCAWCAGPPVENAAPGANPSPVNPAQKKEVRRKTLREGTKPEENEANPPNPRKKSTDKPQNIPVDATPDPTDRKKTQVIRSKDKTPAEGAENKPHLVGWLVNYSQDEAGIAYELREGRYIIGTGSRATIRIPDENSISGEHAILLFRNGRLRFQDNLSTNGSFINGEEIDEKIDLHHGDTVRLGSTDLIVVLVPRDGK